MSANSLTIPADCGFSFVGEGAANIVFAITLADDSPDQTAFKRKLLRVPKAGTKAYPHEELQEYWETHVKPLFEEGDLVQQSLVHLGGRDLIIRLNAVLSENEEKRRADFKGSHVAYVDVGMLVEDMRPQRPDEIALEFKPKWLKQSPNAPSQASRCRNCAREAYRNNKNGIANPVMCPLALLFCQDDPVSMQHVLDHVASKTPEAARERFEEWLRTNTLLKRLKDAQDSLDQNGPLEATDHDAEFQLAMTLRDCTCFVRISDNVVEARLADLDKKNSAAKLDYWQSMERRLADHGYYFATERPLQETQCLWDGMRHVLATIQNTADVPPRDIAKIEADIVELKISLAEVMQMFDDPPGKFMLKIAKAKAIAIDLQDLVAKSKQTLQKTADELTYKMAEAQNMVASIERWLANLKH